MNRAKLINDIVTGIERLINNIRKLINTIKNRNRVNV